MTDHHQQVRPGDHRQGQPQADPQGRPLPGYRNRSGLRPFSPSGLPTFGWDGLPIAGEGCHDKLVVSVTAEIRYASPEALQEYLARLGYSTRFDPVLRINNTRNPSNRRVEVARGWLFGGRGWLNGIRPHGPGIAALTLDLTLNPTRFLAHHAAGTTLDELAAMHPAEALARSDAGPTMLRAARLDVAAEARAAALDGNDNVLVGLGRLGGDRFSRPGGDLPSHRGDRWRRLLDIHLGRVRALLEAELAPSAGEDGRPPVEVSLHWDRAVLREAEAYFEFEHPDALALVAALRERAGAVAAALRTDRFRCDVGDGREGDAPCIHLRLSNHIEAVVYAKCLDRVRFELRYDGVRDRLRPAPRAGTALTDLLELVRHDATRRLGVLIRALAAEATDPARYREDFATLMAALGAAADHDQRVIWRVSTLLLNTGGVTDRDTVVPRRVVRRLAEAGILERHRLRQRGPVRYGLVPRYRAALEAAFEAFRAPPPEGRPS